MKEKGTASANEGEVKEMTNYYLRVARYFLSTGILTGFGVQMEFPRIRVVGSLVDRGTPPFR